MPELPTGTVTFLFTDIEGSTRLLHDLGAEAYGEALAEHRRVLREAFASHGGVEVDTQGDAFFVAFADARSAVTAALEGQQALGGGPIRVRMGLHTGMPHLDREGYVGEDVHLGARIAAAGHGAQVLLSKATRELVDEALLDLGEHRLKDFANPVWIYQLGTDRFPPLKTISNTNLPRPASSFVGRGREVAEITALLSDGARMVTLTGPGGTGKTRLSIEAATELVPEFKAGVFWVPLASLRDPALVSDTIARTLGAKDSVTEHIGEREMLLVLDNLEQVVAAAPELATLVESCPNLRMLVTSRELLRVRGEVEYPVQPLADPDAAALFSARSGFAVDATIEQLCGQLDNLPLAVELAAARVNVLSPKQILERLSQRLDLLRGGRDADPRQQTLRATIEWSYDLLNTDEQILFAGLSVFSGGWTLGSAEAICDADLDVLQSLVDKSLLRHTDDRFWMLETIREYALHRLERSAEVDELRRRHAEHFLALAEEAEPHLFGGSPADWLGRLEREDENFRAALDWLEASGESEGTLRLAGALAEFWGVKGRYAEGRRRLETALSGDEHPTAARAKALNGAADLASGSGDLATARLRAEEGLALNRTLGRAWGTADSLLLLGIATANEGDFATAQQRLDESVRLFRELGDEHNRLEATRHLARACDALGLRERARALSEDNLRRARALRDDQIESRSLVALAGYAIDEDRPHIALPMLKQAYRLQRDLGDLQEIPMIICRFAGLLASAGRASGATRVLSSSETLLEEMGGNLEWLRRLKEDTLETIRKQLDAAAIDEAWEQGKKLTPDEAVELALAELV